MKFISTFSTLLLIYFLSISCVNAADLESVNKLYVKSGLEQQMRDIGPALLTGYQSSYQKFRRTTARDETIHRNINQVIQDSFNPETMKKTVVNGLVREIDESDMQQILVWLDSPTGQKITRLEKRASSKDGMRAAQDYLKNMKKSSLPAERLRLIQDLNSSMKITETTVDITLAAQFAISMITRKTGGKLSRDDLRRYYENFSRKKRSRIKPTIEGQVNNSLLATYRTLPDEDLKRYAAFTQSAAGRKYNTVTSAYMLQAIIESSLKFAWSISQL